MVIDHQSQNLDILVTQEPSTTSHRTHVSHGAWRCVGQRLRPPKFEFAA